MRTLLLLLLAVTLSSCSLVSDGCPPSTFGEECEVLGDWRLQSIGDERATGRLELSALGDAYLALPSGIDGCSDLRGAARWSLDDAEGYFRVRLWNAVATCEDGPDRRFTVDFTGGGYTLDGDRLTASWRPDARLADSGGSTDRTTIPALGDFATPFVFAR